VCVLCDNPDLLAKEKNYVITFKATGHQVRHKAIEMEKTINAAKKMRIRFLTDELYYWGLYENSEICGVFTPGGELRMPYGDVPSILKEIELLRKPEEVAAKDQITPSMVHKAKMYPVDKLLEFKHGKVRCINPDHEDNNPTMYHATRTNTARCPACDANYDAITIIRKQEGVSFHEAVRRLC
jgi:hypothetical protein